MSGINHIKNLQILNLSNNPFITSMSSIVKLVFLEELNLSNNVNFLTLSFTNLPKLTTLKLANMNLTALPDLSSNVLLTKLDLNNNTIATGFDLLPSSLVELEIKGSGSSYCQLNSTPVESIIIDANNLELADCTNIEGLKFIEVDGGNFPNTTQDISDFTGVIGENGLCGLSINNTNLEQLDGMVPFGVSFHLNGNSNLKYVDPLLDSNNQVVPMASFVSIDSNKLLCSNRFKLAEFDPDPVTQSNSGTNKSGIFSACGPVVAIANYYEIPTVCTPDPLVSLEVYQDIETSKRYITWEKDPLVDYAQMDITEYEIKGYDRNAAKLSPFSIKF